MSRKRLICILLSVALIICVFCGCIGCETVYEKNLKRIKETEYFRYINYEGEDTVTILELTELGEQQEVLVIPEEIDGMKVSMIGTRRIKGSSLGPQPGFTLESDCLKKVYMKANNLSLPEWYRLLVNHIDKTIIIINQDIHDAFHCSRTWTENNKFYICDKQSMEQYINNLSFEVRNKENFYTAEFKFWIDDELWWLDTYNEERLYIRPENPSKAGMIFSGWYIEPEFIHLWNGEYQLTDGERGLNLHAKFE